MKGQALYEKCTLNFISCYLETRLTIAHTNFCMQLVLIICQYSLILLGNTDVI